MVIFHLNRRLFALLALAGLLSLVLISPGLASAQASESVHELTGRIDPGSLVIYRLSNLMQGDQLSAYAERIDNVLDYLYPVIWLLALGITVLIFF
jgi:hypothetical protein